ncbi:MGMT family protein [Marinomonas sp. C2222]|uniref:MGMT family protein n=1 Tax=Marinomonas sargassi TaxID=2984494 RepID=A0ABT2YSJ4_9GAMM|nr:MGMT family protein [Marinomonas sargassi]MCV2402847.1 MGMT family protein [Marinomonas sargassi]
MTNQAINGFKSQVLIVLNNIQEGQCIAYGELAKQAGFPNHARQVGTLLKNLPKDTKLPWHRVVNAKHHISFIEGSEAYERQKQKLEEEGWVILGNKLTVNENNKGD